MKKQFTKIALAATLALAIAFTVGCGQHGLDDLEEIIFGTSSSSSNNYSGDWDLGYFDAARDADFLTHTEKDVILEMNKVRSNPKKYAEMYLQPMLQNFNGNIYSVPGQVNIRTNEGAAAVIECIDVLSNAGSVGLLVPEKGLSQAAKDHVADQGPDGLTGHTGTDGSSFGDRIKRYGISGGYRGENISYGRNNGREIVIKLLVDDGTPSRGHRENIMKSAYSKVGVSIGPHAKYGDMCVIDFSSNYISTETNQ